MNFATPNLRSFDRRGGFRGIYTGFSEVDVDVCVGVVAVGMVVVLVDGRRHPNARIARCVEGFGKRVAEPDEDQDHETGLTAMHRIAPRNDRPTKPSMRISRSPAFNYTATRYNFSSLIVVMIQVLTVFAARAVRPLNFRDRQKSQT
jgi:hypothetical protein